MDSWNRQNTANIATPGGGLGQEARPNKHNWINELAKLEKKRIGLHEYILMKLDERDYHAVQDAGSDLRELDARSKAIKEWVDQ